MKLDTMYKTIYLLCTDITALSHRTALAGGAKWTCRSGHNAWLVSCRALSERARGKFKRADACALHAYTNGSEERTLCTCAFSCTCERAWVCAPANCSFLLSVKTDDLGLVTMSASWLYYARALRFRATLIYLHSWTFSIRTMENVLSTSVRQKDWIKKSLKSFHCS